LKKGPSQNRKKELCPLIPIHTNSECDPQNNRDWWLTSPLRIGALAKEKKDVQEEGAVKDVRL